MKIKLLFLSVILIFVFDIAVNSQELLIPLNDHYEMSIQEAAYNSSYRFHTTMKSWSEY